MAQYRFDALILTALQDELEPVLAFGEGGSDAWTEDEGPGGLPYHFREFPRKGGPPLRIAAASFDEMGKSAMALLAGAFISHLNPACLAMCGICAGNKNAVALGDVIIADRVYDYEHGKLIAWLDANGQPARDFYNDLTTHNLKAPWKKKAASFARNLDWATDLVKARPPSRKSQEEWLLHAQLAHEQEGAVRPEQQQEFHTACPDFPLIWDHLRLPEQGLLVPEEGILELTDTGRKRAIELGRKAQSTGFPRDPPFRIHIGPIATGSVVQMDPQLFPRLEKAVRKTLGVEMEAVALGQAADFLNRRVIIVKGVADYADGDKNDAFRKFAARASAEVLLRFLLQELEPSVGKPQSDSPPAMPTVDLRQEDELFSHVRTITELRAQQLGCHVEVHRCEARQPLGLYLHVEKHEPPWLDKYPIGVVEQVTPEVLDVFLTDIHERYQSFDPRVKSRLIYRGDPPSLELETRATSRGVQLQSFTAYREVNDFSGFLKNQSQHLEEDPRYPPALYIPQKLVLSQEGHEVTMENAVDALLQLMSGDSGRLLLVLGDFGTGKTFLLHALALRMAQDPRCPIPFLIDLRPLQKVQTLDALIGSVLAREKIEITVSAFRLMLSAGRIALLFDGFDELVLRVTYDRAVKHLSTLLEAARGEAKVVITSRTQEFESEKKVRTALAQQASLEHGYRLLKLQLFDRAQVHEFLRRRLKSQAETDKYIHLLDGMPDFLELARFPRMLEFLLNLPEETLLEATRSHQKVTKAWLYEKVLTQWIQWETLRGHGESSSSSSHSTQGGLGLSTEQRWRAVTELAKRLWLSGESSFQIDRLPDDLLAAVQSLAAQQRTPAELMHEIGSGTLLIWDKNEDEHFAFIHQSVMEWLVAKEISRELEQETSRLLGMQALSALMVEFVCGLAGQDKAVQWAQDALAQEESPVPLRNNADLILKYLQVKPRVHKYADQDLRDRDFSGESLRYADLRRATLTGVSLRGADLTGAKLAGAKLQRADLSNARLNRADLTGADLSGARLLGAMLTGARLEGTRLQGAKLVGATLDPAALDGRGEDLLGAATTESGPAVPMVSAASWCFAVAISPDGKRVATGHDGSIRLWELESGLELRVLSGHEGIVRSLAFSHDSRLLVSGSVDATVRVWDVISGEQRRLLDGHADSVWSVAFSHDSGLIASGSADKTVRVWDVGSDSEPLVLAGHAQTVWSVAFAPDSQWLASGSDDGTVRLWDLGSRTELRILKGHSSSVLSVAFSPDARWLASGSHDGTVRLWDLNADGVTRRLTGHSRGVWSLAFSHNSQWLASGSEDTTVRLWNLWDVDSTPRVLKGHAQRVWSVAFSSAHHSQVLASASDDTTVRLWDLGLGAEPRVLKGRAQRVWSVAFSHDSQRLALGSADTAAHLWDVRSGSRRHVLEGHTQRVWSVAFSQDSRWLASGSADATVRLWDGATGAERQTLKGHSHGVPSVAFSHDSRWLASGSEDTTIRLWDMSSRGEHRVLRGHSKSVWSVAFSPDSQWLASGSEDATVRLWNLGQGLPCHVRKDHDLRVLSVAFSPDGQWLASGSQDTTVRLWNPITLTVLRVLEGHRQGVLSVAFSPDSQWLASGSEDTTVRLWDMNSDANPRVLVGHVHRVSGVAFSPDGRLLASSSTDGTVRLWDVRTGECLATLVSLAEGWVAFTPDGRYRSAGFTHGAFWHVIGTCRFEPGELDPYLTTKLSLSEEAPLYSLPEPASTTNAA